MGHYETLGVDPSASVEEIKQMYLVLARREHPDLHHDNDVAQQRAEHRMRLINEAWTVLADPDERAAYDRGRLGVRRAPPSSRDGGPRGRGRTTDNDPSPDWEPFDLSGDETEFDENRDEPITSSGIPPWLVVAPVALGAFGPVALVLGSILGARPLMAAGLMALLAAALLFLIAPLFALSRSHHGERPD